LWQALQNRAKIASFLHKDIYSASQTQFRHVARYSHVRAVTVVYYRRMWPCVGQRLCRSYSSSTISAAGRQPSATSTP